VDESLSSPCLFQGDNGQGKSLVAKALAAAIPFRGEAAISGPEGPLRVRLIFQDVLNQTLMRTGRQLVTWEKTDDAAKAYDDLLAHMRRRMPGLDSCPDFFARQGRSDPMRLLEIKLLLAAVRLAEPRTVLILDEPDWGLSRDQAIAFVSAVVHVAHERKIPVILISHKPWWRNLARSARSFHKEAPLNGEGHLFRIRIDTAPAGGP
jgi:ABC-type sugar transport system ATPase subunit